ncbi:MAG: hypothetical protein H7A40_06560 [Chlamydiales bacterium]|nr:hypothetical protein [Chlamydiales bacterium]
MTSGTQTVFFQRPDVLYVDEDDSIKPPPYQTIDHLMNSIKEHGPLVAVGKMGPEAYTVDPFKLKEQINNEDVYGWKPNTAKEYSDSIPVILRGARKTETHAYVFFTLAQDVRRDKESLIRGYKTLDADGKVYIMSFANFFEKSLVNLHPICPHGQWLYSVEVNSILDGGETEKKCKEVGQKIFNYYKALPNGTSETAKQALQRICNAAVFLTPDGQVRKAHIEYAWDGVGDQAWKWRH